jgi:hypothetical protein
MQIRVDRLENFVLGSTFICTTSGTLILISSVILDRLEALGIDRQVHADCCKIWISISLAELTFMFLFLYQRSTLRSSDYWKRQRDGDVALMKMYLECVICVLQISLVWK